MAHIEADDYRVPGEKAAFWVATIALVLLLVPFFPLWPVMAIVVVAFAIGLWMTQGASLGSCVRVSEKQFPEIHLLAGRGPSGFLCF